MDEITLMKCIEIYQNKFAVFTVHLKEIIYNNRSSIALKHLQETRSFLRVLIIIYVQQLASRGWASEPIRPANDAVIYKTRVASRFVFD